MTHPPLLLVLLLLLYRNSLLSPLFTFFSFHFLTTNMSNNIGCYHPFTSTQWQELEQQALIYKYMQSGIPIPSELLLSIQRSSTTNFFLNSTTNPFTHPTIGWSFAQMGNGRRTEDAEPGRCKRTDGKKWRCSKEATPDSKYCERHMHRGKNRSRKPVEISLATNNNNATITTTPSFSKASSSYPQYPYNLMYPHPHQPHNTTNFSSTDKDYKDYSFMTERESPWELKPLMLGEPRKREEEEEEEEKNKHCFVLGADFRLEKPVKERDFFDDWPGRNKGTTSWMGLEGESSTQGSAYSKTQNSISLPMGLHNFLQ